MLQAVIGDADQPHPEGDGRIPPPVDDAVEIGRDQGGQHCPGAAVYGVEVIQKGGRRLWPDRRHLRGGVAVADVRRIRIEAEARGPVVPNPKLLRTEDLGDVMILDPGEVPDQPADGIGSGAGRFCQPVDVNAVDGGARASGGMRP